MKKKHEKIIKKAIKNRFIEQFKNFTLKYYLCHGLHNS